MGSSGPSKVPSMTQISNLIKDERERQNKKWGEQNHDDYRWLAILLEEVGELAEAVLHDEFGGHAKGHTYIELIHVAAVAIQWLECMDRRSLNVAPQNIRTDTVDKMRKVLEEVHDYIAHITTSRKGSIGSIDNTYLPQLNRKLADKLFVKIKAALEESGR